MVWLGSLCLIGKAKATAPIGDVVSFSPSTNWYSWIVRVYNETGRGQVFKTSTTTNAIRSVGLKLCRQSDFTKPKTFTLCSSAQSGYFAGCSNPLASKTYTASELNNMIPYDANCSANNEGGNEDGTYFKWVYFTFDNSILVSSTASYFFLFNSGSANDNENNGLLRNMYNNCHYNGSSQDYLDGQTYYYQSATRYQESLGASCDMLFKVFSDDPDPTPFAITSHQDNDPYEKDTWVTVTGTCPTNEINQVGLTNNCYSFNDVNYNLDCVSNTFSGKIYMDGSKDKLAAIDRNSTAGDCVAYDNLMDVVNVRSIEIIQGYPDDWYFNFSYYDDYDIKILSPVFQLPSITQPYGTTSTLFTFQFVYPPAELNNLTFNIKQYDHDGNLLNSSYHVSALSAMANTQSYGVNLTATSSGGTHYVVQLIGTGNDMKRQYPFGVFVSDLEYSFNSHETKSLFPRLVSELKKKIVFNYYFAFHDGFYDMFNASSTYATATALDITLKSMSDDKKYDLDVKIFSFSDPIVKKFSDGLSPYITAFLWLIFALYVVLRIARLFNNNN